MDEKDRWSVHVEYLKLAIALATALIAAAAAIYVDDTKIPSDVSRYFLIGGIAVFFVTLICSVWSLASLGNLLIHVPRQDATPATPAINPHARRAVLLANLSFVCLVGGVGLLVTFFLLRTFNAGGASFERALATAKIANRDLTAKGEAVSLKSIEFVGNEFQLIFQITPGPGTTAIVTDGNGTFKSSKRQ